MPETPLDAWLAAVEKDKDCSHHPRCAYLPRLLRLFGEMKGRVESLVGWWEIGKALSAGRADFEALKTLLTQDPGEK